MDLNVCGAEQQREEGRRPGLEVVANGRCQEKHPPDEVPVGISAPAEAHGAVAMEKLLEK